MYWENPEILIRAGARFPVAVSGGGVSAVVWQENTFTEEVRGVADLYVISRSGSREWGERVQIGDQYNFTGKEVPLFSACINNEGHIFIAVRNERESIDIYRSTDGGASFTQTDSVFSFATTVAPRIFAKDDGGIILFVTRETVTQELGDSLEIYYTVSDDGNEWTEVAPLVREAGKKLNFLPYHISHLGREYVVLQVLETADRPSYQVYITSSTDGGRSFGDLTWVTGFQEFVDGAEQDPQLFDNQRPYIMGLNGTLAVVWERRLGGQNPQIYYAELNRNGSLMGEAEPVTTGARNCQFPRLFSAEGRTYVTWFDDRAGNEHVILAYRDGVFWRDRDITGVDGISTFPRTIIEDGKPFIFWENRLGNTSRLVYLAPDETAPAPTPFAENFVPGGRFDQDLYAVRWSLPEDSSGISGFAYSWDKDPEGRPPERIMTLQRTREAEYTAEEDGMWYFHVSSNDYAGNWSPPAHLSFFRDTTPPEPVSIIQPEEDENGYLLSNSFTLEWDPPEGEEYIAGYSYNLQYLGGFNVNYEEEDFTIIPPPERVMTADEEVYFRNRDNGLWAFSVRAVDTVGNASEPEHIIFNLNKYIPETYITTIDADVDALGRVTLTIYGRGFAVGGNVSKVIIDRDGAEPFDYEYLQEFGAYEVAGDRQINGPVIEDVDEGRYRVGLLHPERGLYFTRPYLDLESTGAVKFGDFTAVKERQWRPVRQTLFTLSANSFLFYLILALLAAGLIFSVIKVSTVVREGNKLEAEVRALIMQRDLTERQKKERLKEMKKRGMGLRLKFTLFITMLIIVVVLMVAAALAYVAINTQRENLAAGLEKQTEVLLESLTSSAGTYLPAKNTLELGLIPERRFAMEDSLFVTITGGGETDPENFDYVWATDDENIETKIDTDSLAIGVSRIRDEVSPEAEALKRQINRNARDALGDITEQLDILGERAREIALSEEEGAEEQLAQYQQEISDLERQVNRKLKELGDVIASVPEFNVDNLEDASRRYIFYKPVVYRTIGQDTYYKGLVRLGVSTDRIIAEIDASVRNLIFIIGVIAVISIAIGVVGSIIFASIMIIPIKRLVSGVEIIRDTEDKEELESHTIKTRTKDELNDLAETINGMTQSLAQAAKSTKALVLGKEVQKMFIPLDTDSSGHKLSTGGFDNQFIEVFGYYEGADELSGDYFDYIDLKNGYQAFIKCDVAGHGAAAALIMVEVATIFSSHFRNYVGKKPNLNLTELVNSINDLVEERKFVGRFAALMVILLEVSTGKMYICHAGDNMLHIYEKANYRVNVQKYPMVPAAGMFDRSMLDMQGGYQQYTHQLNSGDIMFLFTDGIEESRSYFLDDEWDRIRILKDGRTVKERQWAEERSSRRGESSGSGPPQREDEGEQFAELTLDRMEAVINTFFKKGVYTLDREHFPLSENFVFDFSSTSGSIEEVVLALMAVEKVWRIVPAPDAGLNDRITVDKKIDEFLRKTFNLYSQFFHDPIEDSTQNEYIQFPFLREDAQEDDLTILVVRKK